MDVRQFLLDAPETCFFTCYDLLLHAKDGSTHHLEDYHEISEVADITCGDCSLEMIAGMLHFFAIMPFGALHQYYRGGRVACVTHLMKNQLILIMLISNVSN